MTLNLLLVINLNRRWCKINEYISCAPHADDEILGVGGTIAKYVDEVTMSTFVL